MAGQHLGRCNGRHNRRLRVRFPSQPPRGTVRALSVSTLLSLRAVVRRPEPLFPCLSPFSLTRTRRAIRVIRHGPGWGFRVRRLRGRAALEHSRGSSPSCASSLGVFTFQNPVPPGNAVPYAKAMRGAWLGLGLPPQPAGAARLRQPTAALSMITSLAPRKDGAAGGPEFRCQDSQVLKIPRSRQGKNVCRYAPYGRKV